ncbi:hypothetical protein EAI30_12415 [Romboutsia ilealis]|uniref:DUF5808 domain-containing protein n=1 Tax=Romboutsia faecis TaxID=2764597 RepID=A0ABR7JRU8_9FIRM|nr:DUF5808 domain-containing protein [Romboutsia faecis]MBC5997629.1 hypothetical protein [Romboutsia faecis]MRN25421.1 hypothetical protein [Romboutsia ilealis]
MNNILYLSSYFLPLIILYLIFSNMNILNGNKYLYGVNIDKNYIDENQIKAFNKKFKFYHTIGFIVVLLLFIMFMFFSNNIEIGFTFALIAYLVYSSIIYVILHSKIKNIKSELLKNNVVSERKTAQVFVDMEFLNERDKLINKFKYLYLIPILIVLVGCIFTFINKDNLGEYIPTQFDYNGSVQDFIPNTTINLLGCLLSMLGSVILISFISISSLKSRLKVDTENIEISKSENIKYLRKTGYGFFILVISFTLLAICSFISMFGISINPFIFKITTFITLASVVLLCLNFVKSPNSKYTSSYSSEDDEKNWIFGMVYNNPNDPSFMVQKRFGIGWTINIGSPLGKLFFITTIVALGFSLFSLIKNMF